MATTTRNGKVLSGNRRMGNVLVEPSLVYDTHVARIIDAPSPAKMAALLDRIDQGELGLLCQLQAEMERKSDQFAGVVQTRRNAVAALDWCIEPDPNADEEDAFAQEVADYVGDKLTILDLWDEVLWHLSEAIGPNLAVVELIWNKGELADFVIVPYTRLASHPISNSGVVIRTDEEPIGFPVELFPNKFIVFVPNSKGGFPFRTTLTHASIRAYLMTYHSTVDWMSFSELFGCPVRTATHDETAIPADVDTVKEEINKGGTDVAIVLPKGWELEFKQAAGTGETYAKQLQHTDASMAKLWLGQTLTTDIGSVGSRAAAEVHNDVRHDIRDADIKAEACAIRRQLIRPMVQLKYPGRDAPIPVFVRKTYEARDIESEKLTLDQLRFAGEKNLRLDEDVIYDRLNLPKPTTPEPKKKTEQDTAATINELTLGIERATRTGDLALVNLLREKIAELLGSPLPPLTELPKIAPAVGQPKLTNESGSKEDGNAVADAEA